MTRRITNLAFGAPTLRGPDLSTHQSTLTTSAGIGKTQASTKESRTNFVTLLEPGSGETDCGRMTSRECANSAASVQATFTPGESWPKHRADSLVDGIPASGLTSTSRVGDRNRSSPNLGT